MRINGRTKTLGLIGNPVEHTYSPLIHMSLAEIFHDNYAYLPFRVEKEGLPGAIAGAYALNIMGLNVTVPYKQAVLPYLVSVDEYGTKAKAVNTLVRVNGGFVGYNTDIPGLLRAMKSDGVEIQGSEALVLGAGGAARAAAYMLLDNGAKHIWIVNRSLDKAAQLAAELNQEGSFPKGEVSSQESSAPKAEALTYEQALYLKGHKRFLAIQATSVGMYPKEDQAVIEDDAFYEKLHTAYDVIFNPSQTLFLQKAQKAGAKTYNGGKMLLCQAVTAYELWTGNAVSEEVVEKVYLQLTEAMEGEK
jgi:shikimate dehydrogenase